MSIARTVILALGISACSHAKPAVKPALTAEQIMAAKVSAAAADCRTRFATTIDRLGCNDKEAENLGINPDLNVLRRISNGTFTKK